MTAHFGPKRTTKGAACLSLMTTFLVAIVPASARDNISMERLAICQDSWIDWQKSSPAELKRLADVLQSNFTRKEQDPFFVPKSAETILGLLVAQVFPESIGMAVGFSVLVNANFKAAKAAVEKRIAKPITKCETGDNMRGCELQIAEQKTITLAADEDPKSTQTLIGYYYLYAK